ncbi:MAG: tRNA 2-selenouridine(34) synthase MnmH [Sedimentitalea sp.]
MAQEFPSLDAVLAHGFDNVIDVRSPAEFALDHVPGAINLPVLNNEERAEVGTIYVQQSSFTARKIGAAKVFRNAADHIDTSLRHHPGSWRPLVYCWRGGQRSGAFSWMLGQIGWRAEVLSGGYRSYRRLVNDMLYTKPLPHRLVALDGYTGTAKTALLHHVAARGGQVIDLEGAAGHRGSLLGALDVPQPSQKAFETDIAAALSACDPARPVLVEAESSKIGDRSLPPSVWTGLCAAPAIQVTAPIAARTQYLVQAYDDILSDSARLSGLLSHLRAHRGHAVVDGWNALIKAGDKAALTRALMEQHYDPAYARARRNRTRTTLFDVTCDSLDDAALARAADQIVEGLERLTLPT